MSDWTDERVDLLKKGWTDGHSASQIARQLGGVSRNGVIGKLHRLGLGGRTAASAPVQAPPKPRAPREPTPNAHRIAAAATKEAAVKAADAEPPVIIAGPGFATMLTIGGRMCRWPIGDPALPSFTMCGRHTETGPYCHEHAQVAYLPATAKKKPSANELARSLRRYL